LNKLKFNISIIKIVLIIIGIIINKYIENSSEFLWLKNEFSQMKGIKLYSIFKIVEYIISLFNKFGYDMDLQIYKIIETKKLKQKIFSFIILLLFIFLNLYFFNIYYYCTWLILNDIEKNFFLIYLKVNFIEFKQANKSFKSLHNYLANDIFDRFFNIFIMIFICIDGINENKIQINFNNIYFKRICLYFISEFISDYLKGIIAFKINNNKYFYLNDTKEYKNNISFIDKESIICMILNINIYPFIILFSNQIFFNKKFFSFYLILKPVVLIVIKFVIEALIKLFRYSKNSKNEINNERENKIKFV
jgi:ABC-type multidrug transport system fused ATPase/permease subunit